MFLYNNICTVRPTSRGSSDVVLTELLTSREENQEKIRKKNKSQIRSLQKSTANFRVVTTRRPYCSI